jgi:hypothetical protein
LSTSAQTFLSTDRFRHQAQESRHSAHPGEHLQRPQFMSTVLKKLDRFKTENTFKTI